MDSIQTETSMTTTRMPGKILIVDDDELNRMILANIFSDDYEILEASNGEEGVRLLLSDIPDIAAVLLDVMMPVMDGIQFLEKVRSKGWNGGIPIFLITAESDTQVLSRAYALGVMDTIAKPVVPYMVRRRVDSVIELFMARKRLRARVEEQQHQLDEQARRILELNHSMIEVLSTAVEFRSAESGSHVKRIHDITKCLLLNTELGVGMSYETIEIIATASIMHDIGRGIQIFAHSFPDEEIEKDCHTVLKDLTTIDREVTATNGRHYTLRIAPYRTTENNIRGLVITIIDSLGVDRETDGKG